MRPIHDHEIQHVAALAPFTARSALELLELPSLFVALLVAWSLIFGEAPWWLFVGAAFYGGLGGLVLGWEVWRGWRGRAP